VVERLPSEHEFKPQYHQKKKKKKIFKKYDFFHLAYRENSEIQYPMLVGGN
jgi:hypothetical protein